MTDTLADLAAQGAAGSSPQSGPDPRPSELLRAGMALVQGQTIYKQFSNADGEVIDNDTVEEFLDRGEPVLACATGCIRLGLARHLGVPRRDSTLLSAHYCLVIPTGVEESIITWNDHEGLSLEEIAQRLEERDL